MYRIIAITAFVAVCISSVALAQQAEPLLTPETMPSQSSLPILQPNGGPMLTPRVQVEQQYGWFTNILRRYGTQSGGSIDDSARIDVTIPLNFGGGTEFRGLGQIFAPAVLTSFYSPGIYNETSFIIFASDDSAGRTDQQYIDQFKDAGAYSVDSVIYSMYRNPNGNTPEHGAKFQVFKSKYNFKQASYKTSGMSRIGRNSLLGFPEYGNKPYTRDISTDDLDNTLDPSGTTFNRTTERFDPPLTASALPADNESMIFMYINDTAPALSSPIPADGEYQRMVGTLEYREGESAGSDADTLHNPIDKWLTFGAVMYHSGTKDSIYSAFGALLFGSKVAVLNISMTMFGTIDLNSDVKYHFGQTATTNGLGAASPNPSSVQSRVPFTITERSHVKIDVYASNGELVSNLVNETYMPGVYSVDVPVTQLAAGNYRVRMIAGTHVYSTSVIVAK